MPNTIQPGESALIRPQRAVARTAPRARNRDPNGNLNVRYLNWNGDRWNWNANWLENDWNDTKPAALRATTPVSPRITFGEFLLYGVTRKVIELKRWSLPK